MQPRIQTGRLCSSPGGAVAELLELPFVCAEEDEAVEQMLNQVHCIRHPHPQEPHPREIGAEPDEEEDCRDHEAYVRNAEEYREQSPAANGPLVALRVFHAALAHQRQMARWWHFVSSTQHWHTSACLIIRS
eukprot:CAMPEP_0114537514 /NCGR_PEP_ID=MMETSP0109-20121206/29622_1 /TAXON_ID=29199 /ORGANISM="Chlorarachnion reptans, Strain CCCM449" /LENGTH=131 /DNA_ID=CAMNT_0001721415 /DNA_START=300 /DNA_END=696 /DNA_ORIENTATION=+